MTFVLFSAFFNILIFRFLIKCLAILFPTMPKRSRTSLQMPLHASSWSSRDLCVDILFEHPWSVLLQKMYQRCLHRWDSEPIWFSLERPQVLWEGGRGNIKASSRVLWPRRYPTRGEVRHRLWDRKFYYSNICCTLLVSALIGHNNYITELSSWNGSTCITVTYN